MPTVAIYPRRMRLAVLPRISRRNSGVACFNEPGGVTTAALGLATGGGGLFQFGLAAGGEFGDHARREGTKRLPSVGVSHDRNHGGINVREVVSVVQGPSYVQ